MRLVAAVERNSEHPLAVAIVRYAQSQNIDFPEATQFKAIAGSGVQGIVSARLVQIGTQRWMSELGISTTALQEQKEIWEADGKTVVLIAVDGELEGIMAIADAIKLDSPEAVRALRKLDLEVVMLTGDNVLGIPIAGTVKLIWNRAEEVTITLNLFNLTVSENECSRKNICKIAAIFCFRTKYSIIG